jgi:ATP-dependent Lon protease
MTARENDFDPRRLDSSPTGSDTLAGPGQDFVIFSREPAEDGPAAGPTHLPILPLKDTVIFPETMMPLAVGQPRSVHLIDDVLRRDKLVGLFTAKDPEIEVPGPGDVYTVGVLASIQKMLKAPDGTLRIIAQGIRRIEIERFASEEPYLWADVHDLPDVVELGTELEALQRNLVAVYTKIIQLVPYLPDELEMAAANIEDPAALGYFIASTMRLKTEEKQELLAEVELSKRLRRLTALMNRELEVLELGSKIQDQVQSEMDKSQREYVLRQQLKAIQDELGETDETQAEVNELRERIDKADLPEEVEKQARRELDRLSKLPTAAAEYGVIRTYLDWIVSLPWSVVTTDNLDIGHARQVLDEDHYDLDDVKDRILELLAVQKLKEDVSGSILCFAGPPGVGKTSLGKSIARAMGRKFIRISVGGVRDESEIRGHRRTYVGAMPGTIIRAIRDAGSCNPVFMIDEIDKMGADWRGDPSSAMLEVLDPEQNSSFRDHYLDLPFDLSRAMFICTANVLDTIPGPLRDRMEIISIAGYTEEDKLHIARRYLVPRQIERNGLKKGQLTITDTALRVLIENYTREAGVRSLEREIGTIARKFARMVAEEGRKRLTVGEKRVTEFLGKKKVFRESKRRTSDPGVSTGLAWTPTGGDILFIEARAMPGAGRLILTGQLGDVMKESAQAALTYVRSASSKLGADAKFFQKNDIHVHVPAGAVPKDGPSAGVAMAVALASMASGRAVDPSVAMTGEVTLTGQVLPVGGIKEKVLAAKAAGITQVFLPDRNEADVDEIRGEDILEDLELRYVEHVSTVLDEALLPGKTRRKGAAAGAATTAARARATKRSAKTATVRAGIKTGAAKTGVAKTGGTKTRAKRGPATRATAVKRSTGAATMEIERETETRGAVERTGVYSELNHPADLFLEIWGRDLPALFQNALFALYDQLVELEGFEERSQVTIETQGATLPDTLRSLLSEALYRFSTEGFVAVKAEVSVAVEQTNAVRAIARLSGENVDRQRHTLLTEVKAVTYHQLAVEAAPEGGWRATVLLDV